MHPTPAPLRNRKEKQIAPLQSSVCRVADFRLTDSPARKVDADLLIDVLRQAGAIEGVRTFGAPYVGPSNEPLREIDNILGRRAGSKHKEAHGYRTRNVANHGSPVYRCGRLCAHA